MTGSPVVRKWVLAASVVAIVVSAALVSFIVFTRGAGDGLALGDRLSSLRDDDVPGASASDEREQALSLSREFATRFNSYDPSMLDDAGHLPDYAAVQDLMTPKFGAVFEKNVGYAEQTVKQLGVTSVGTVYAVGVASQDKDSAQVLVAGTIELSYPYPDDKGKGGGTGEGEDQSISTGPQRVRYELSLVKVDGTWLVDDVDDVDDGLPPFSEPSIPEEPGAPGTTPSTAPSTAPSDGTTTEPTEEGEQ